MSGSARDASLRSRFLWPLMAVVVSAALAMTRLVGSSGFYFADDSQLGAFGQWFELGDHLLRGSLPMLNPAAWQAGNYWAEGQWGLLNPLTWAVAVFTRLIDDPVVSMTVVKVLFLAGMTLGVYLLARTFGAAPPWAALAGILAPLAGFTVFMDAPSWATGLFNAAVLPWAWWALRRVVEDGAGPVGYLAASYLLITFGYVFGVMILAMVLVESLVRAVVARDRRRILASFLASVWGALVTVIVYLPGILTAPVTERAGFSVFNVGFLNADLTDMGSAASPTATGSIGAWWGFATDAPLAYVAWAIPLFGLFLPVSRAIVMRSVPLLVIGGIALLMVIGPSHVGPLRWPIRMMPYLVIAVVVLLAVVATTAFPGQITRRRALAAFGILAAMTYLAFANAPGGWRSLALVALLQAAAIAVIWWFAVRRERRVRPSGRRTTYGVLVAVAVTAALVPLQMRLFPETPLPVNAVPRSVQQMTSTLAGSPGDAFVVGDVYAGSDDELSYRERLIANLWYLSPTPVGSLYTVLPFSTFSNDLCTDLRGSTCEAALATLWSTDETTSRSVADLMALSTVVAMTATYPDIPEVPDGWSVRSGGEFTWVLERGEPVEGAGGVVSTGRGTEVEAVSVSDDAVTFTVSSVGADSRVVLSRLAYPGYTVNGAELADPVRGWLLTVDVAGLAAGDIVTVSFRPPGFVVEMIAAVLVAGLLVGWPLGRILVRRRVSSRWDRHGRDIRPSTEA